VKNVSPKVGAAALGAALATIIWTLVASLSPGTFSDEAIVSLTGSTGVVLAAVLGYVCPDPMRQIERVEPRDSRQRSDGAIA
jgi:hypothetical protein